MFGSFSEEALLAYAEQVAAQYKETAVKSSGPGSEWADNAGIGQNDKSFIEEDESNERDDYTGKSGKVKKALKAKGVVPGAQPRTTNTHGHTANLFSHCEGTEWDSYDFTVCVRDNGTIYGTKGKCRLGKETSEDQAALLRASNRKRSRGTLGGSLKQRVARDKEANHLATQLKDLESERNKARKRLSAAAANLEKNKGREDARLKYKKAQSEANEVLTRHERVRTALNKRVRELTAEQKTQNQGPRKKTKTDFPDWASDGKQLLG